MQLRETESKALWGCRAAAAHDMILREIKRRAGDAPDVKPDSPAAGDGAKRRRQTAPEELCPYCEHVYTVRDGLSTKINSAGERCVDLGRLPQHVMSVLTAWIVAWCWIGVVPSLTLRWRIPEPQGSDQDFRIEIIFSSSSLHTCKDWLCQES